MIKEERKTDYFLERREVAIIHIGGGKGQVNVNGETYQLDKRDCLFPLTVLTNDIQVANELQLE